MANVLVLVHSFQNMSNKISQYAFFVINITQEIVYRSKTERFQMRLD